MREPWDDIHNYYKKQAEHTLTEEDKRLFVEACESLIGTGALCTGYEVSPDKRAALYNLACFYEEEGEQRLAEQYFALYKKANEYNSRMDEERRNKKRL